MQIAEIVTFLEHFAPLSLAEEWDNVGLLVGRTTVNVERIMTCLTLSHATVEEAVSKGAQLVVSHHPLPFRPVRTLTESTHEGALLLRLIESGIAVYSPHTAFDSARDGINFRLASLMGLEDIKPLSPRIGDASGDDTGSGRIGRLTKAISFTDFRWKLTEVLRVMGVQLVGPADCMIQRVAIGCGSAGELLPLVMEAKADCFVTGEMRFHDCQWASDAGLCVVLLGHYPSERLGVDHLANVLAREFPDLKIWASRNERDPLRYL